MYIYHEHNAHKNKIYKILIFKYSFLSPKRERVTSSRPLSIIFDLFQNVVNIFTYFGGISFPFAGWRLTNCFRYRRFRCRASWMHFRLSNSTPGLRFDCCWTDIPWPRLTYDYEDRSGGRAICYIIKYNKFQLAGERRSS